MLKVLTSTSTNFGFKPAWIIGHNDVDQQSYGIKHSSPLFNRYWDFGLTQEKIASRFAEEPELTIKEYFDPIYLEKFTSNFFVISDIVILPLRITSIPAIKSSFSKGSPISE